MQPQLEELVTPFEAAPRKKRASKGRGFVASAELRELKERYLSWMLATRYAESTIAGANGSISPARTRPRRSAFTTSSTGSTGPGGSSSGWRRT